MINMCPKTGRVCELTGCTGCWKDEKQMTNQYVLGYKAGLDAAVKVCREYDASVWSHCNASSHAADMVAATLSQTIEALPVPEVEQSEPCTDSVQSREWREITDDDVLEVMRDVYPATHPQLFARAVLAKFKEKQL